MLVGSTLILDGCCTVINELQQYCEAETICCSCSVFHCRCIFYHCSVYHCSLVQVVYS